MYSNIFLSFNIREINLQHSTFHLSPLLAVRFSFSNTWFIRSIKGFEIWSATDRHASALI